MKLKDYIKMSDYHLKRYDNMYTRYKQMYAEPDNCLPMFIINTPVENLPTWEERLADPLVMLKADLDGIKNHMEIEDDCVPAVRVNFGTGQIAAAFGCEMFLPQNNLPCAGTHVLKNAKDVYGMTMPSFADGWYPKLTEFTNVYLENLPKGVNIQLPDIQSAFNSAHLIRGNDILLDFYDEPEAVEALLDLVTDFMLDLLPNLREPITKDDEWFFDWGAMWKGKARISNCTMHLISPDLYKEHVYSRDERFFKSIGGGRIHYCGTYRNVIDEFLKMDNVSGIDFDFGLHDIYELSQSAPKNFTLLGWNGQHHEKQERLVNELLNGNWPEKRNIIFQFYAPSVEEGKVLLNKLKKSIPF
jgi:hypothetical protein